MQEEEKFVFPGTSRVAVILGPERRSPPLTTASCTYEAAGVEP